MKKILLIVSVLAALALGACNSSTNTSDEDKNSKPLEVSHHARHVMTKAEQDSLTPDQVLQIGRAHV